MLEKILHWTSFIQYVWLSFFLLPFTFLFLSYRGNAHRRPIMWFQCLCLWGTAPSGGKPLRLCWHITTPIINSRSALSFLLNLSSFLLTAAHLLLCFFLWFIHLHSPLHISFNLVLTMLIFLYPFSLLLFCSKLLILSPNNLEGFLETSTD